MTTFTRVQHNSMATTGTAGSSFAATLGSGVTAGNLLVATVTMGTNITLTVPSGWAQAGPAETVTGSLQTQIYYLVDVTGGDTSWTWSWTGSHSFGWTIDEWNSSTGWAASIVDSSAGAANSGGSTAVNCGSPAATTQAAELWYGVLSWANSGQTLSGVTSGWTTGDTATFTSNNTNTGFYQAVSTTGTPSLAATISASEINAGVVATFAAGTGASGVAEVANQPPYRGRMSPHRHHLRRQQQMTVPQPLPPAVLVVTPKVADQVSSSGGVANSVTSISPVAGSMVRISACWLDATDLLGKTFTCKDSNSVSYTTTLAGGDSDGGCYLLIFDHVYATAPGAITVTITCSNTATADCLIQPYLITGQAADQSPAGTASVNGNVSTTTCEVTLTTTLAGSYVSVLGAPNNANHPVPTAIAGTTTDSEWDDDAVGSHGVTGRSTGATVTPGATTFGWTLSTASVFGFGAIAAEILPVSNPVNANFTAGVATATATAQSPAPGPVPPVATGTGTAQQPVAQVTITAGLASAAGTAGNPFFAAFAGLASATGTAQAPTVVTAVPLIDTAVTSDQLSAASGVATSTHSFSPGAGSMVVVLVSWMFATNIVTQLTCKDSSGTVYTTGPQIQDTQGIGVSAIFTHQYASAPGSIHVVVTSSATTAADAIISPRILTGQDLLQTGAASATLSPSTTQTTISESVTTTTPGSYVFVVTDVGGNQTLTPVASTTSISLWNDLSAGDTGGTGRTTSITGTPGAVTVGWTSPTTEYYAIAALEVLPVLGIKAAAGLASATGAALRPDNTEVDSYPGLARAVATVAGSTSTYLTSDLVASPGLAVPGLVTPGAPLVLPGASAGRVPAVATATGTAFGATITTTGNKSVSATVATASGIAWQPVAGITPASVALATATGTGNSPAVQADALPVAGLATGTGTAWSVTFVYITSPSLTVSGFGTFPQVPSTAVILAVIANIVQHGSDPQIEAPSYQLWDGTTAQIGTAQSGAASTSASHIDSVVFTGVSYSQLATLQLRIYATSQLLNSGATVSVDAASLSVEWVPNASTTAAPSVLAVKPKVQAVKVNTGVAATPATVAVTPVVYTVTVNSLSTTVLLARLKVPVALPKVAAGSGMTAAPGTLAVTTTFPGVIDPTVPGWASAETITGSGSGTWSNAGNVTGSPDGSYAVWTAP